MSIFNVKCMIEHRLFAHCCARQKNTKRKTSTSNHMALKSIHELLETQDCSIWNALISFSVITILNNARQWCFLKSMQTFPHFSLIKSITQWLFCFNDSASTLPRLSLNGGVRINHNTERHPSEPGENKSLSSILRVLCY